MIVSVCKSDCNELISLRELQKDNLAKIARIAALERKIRVSVIGG